MKSGAVIALMVAALSWPAFAQRGSARGGFGNRGFAGHGSFSARPGVSAQRGFYGHRGASEPGGYRPAAPFRYGSLGPPPEVRYNPPRISTPHIGVSQNGIVESRPAYRADFNGRGHIWEGNRQRGRDHRRDRNRDRDRFRGRARSFEGWYLFSYPGWAGYGYPYEDSGFYDGSDYGNSGYDQGSEASDYGNESPGYLPESPNGEYGEPGGESSGPAGIYGEAGGGEAGEQPRPWPEPPATEPTPGNHFWVSGLSAASAPSPSGPLTVIFKGGRAPEQMRNYMLTAQALTDLDADRYEQIPLDQIDLDATVRANRASGLEFRVPGAAQD